MERRRTVDGGGDETVPILELTSWLRLICGLCDIHADRISTYLLLIIIILRSRRRVGAVCVVAGTVIDLRRRRAAHLPEPGAKESDVSASVNRRSGGRQRRHLNMVIDEIERVERAVRISPSNEIHVVRSPVRPAI